MTKLSMNRSTGFDSMPSEVATSHRVHASWQCMRLRGAKSSEDHGPVRNKIGLLPVIRQPAEVVAGMYHQQQ